MIKRYGVEISSWPMNDKLEKFVVDKDDQLAILSKENASQFLNALSSQEFSMETYSLIEIQGSELTPLFPDYGFISASNRVYLYAETVLAFSIIDGSATEIKMALLQYEEYLIAKTIVNGYFVYFIDKNYTDLLTKVASAYGINVHIFDLDK